MDEKTWIDSIYCRDASIATDFGMIICNMGKKRRVYEPKAQLEAYQQNTLEILGEITFPGTLEGGDVAWLDQNTLAVGHTYRTNEAGIDQLKALLAKDSDDLKPADIRFIENKIAEKELVQKMIVNKDSVIKTNTLTKTIEQKDSLKSNGATTVNVVDTSNKSNVSNYSSRTDQIVEMRDSTLEMTAFEMNNFFRTR